MSNPILDWNADDVIALRTYISKNPKFLHFLTSRIPEVTGATRDEAANTGMRSQGWKDVIDCISRDMCADPIKSQASSDFLATR